MARRWQVVAVFAIAGAAAACHGGATRTTPALSPSMVSAPPIAGLASILAGPCKGTTAVIHAGDRNYPVRPHSVLRVSTREKLTLATRAGCKDILAFGVPGNGLVTGRDTSIVARRPGAVSVSIFYGACDYSNPPCVGPVADLATVKLRIAGAAE